MPSNVWYSARLGFSFFLRRVFRLQSLLTLLVLQSYTIDNSLRLNPNCSFSTKNLIRGRLFRFFDVRIQFWICITRNPQILYFPPIRKKSQNLVIVSLFESLRRLISLSLSLPYFGTLKLNGLSFVFLLIISLIDYIRIYKLVPA